MTGAPTYIIGLGGTGVRVVKSLHSQFSASPSKREHIGLMAIDSDHRELSRLSEISTIHLSSDSGPVGAAIETYPYLSRDIYVASDGADRRRHIGRYKLDNPVSPTFMNHYKTLERDLKSFFDERQNNLSNGPNSYTIVLVTSFAGGTGSGTFPVFGAMLDKIRQEHWGRQTDVRIVGVGIVPSLNDSQNQVPTEPVAYPNTYGALRNLTTLLSVNDEQQLEVPIYSWTSKAQTEKSPEVPGTTFQLNQSPFDLYWLTDWDFSKQGDCSSLRDHSEVLKMLGNAIYAFSGHTTHQHSLWSKDRMLSPLGTIGYSAIAVPHQTLQTYCELKRDRDEIQNDVEQFIEPKLTQLRNRRCGLKSALSLQIEDSSLFVDASKHIYNQLPDISDDASAFVRELNSDELAISLDTVAESDVQSYALATQAIKWTLSRNGDVGSRVYSDAKKAIQSVRTNYDFQLVGEPMFRMSISEQLYAVENALEQRKESYQNRLSESKPTVRDILPPKHTFLTSERERVERSLKKIDDDLNTLEGVKATLGALEELYSLAKKRVTDARDRLTKEMDRVEREISHFEQQEEELRTALENLRDELTAVRHSLLEPPNNGPVRFLRLDRNTLLNLTPSIFENLASIRDYSECGLISEDEVLWGSLFRCYEDSRDWSEAVTRHEKSVATSAIHDETIVLYHQENEYLIEDVSATFSDSDIVRTSTDQNIRYTDNPHRIEVVSVSHEGEPESLVGFQRLASWKREGILKTLATQYDDHRRALAYPEWYNNELRDAFE